MKPHRTEAQRILLLNRLKNASCTTVQARHELDIIAPAARIFELRHNYGHNIKTFWTTAINPGGRNHRVARYVLFPGQFQEDK